MFKWALGLLTLATVLIVMLVASRWRSSVETISGFIEADEIRLGSRVGGRVAAVHVEEGDQVKTGDVLVELEPFDLNSREAEARANLAARRADLQRLEAGLRPQEITQARQHFEQLNARLRKLRAGPRPQEIEAARARQSVGLAKLKLAQEEHRRTRSLFERKVSTQEEVDRAIQQLAAATGELDVFTKELDLLEEGTRKEDIEAAEAQMEEARAAWQLAEAGFRKEEISQAKANVEATEAMLAAIREQQRELKITAPSAGVIESLELEPGDLAGANVPVLSMLDTSRLWVRAYLPEDMRLELGQRLAVTVDSFPDRRFAGQVTFISRQAEFTPNNVQTPEERAKQVFRIKVTLRQEQNVLRAGMIADVWLNEPLEGDH